MVVVRIMMGRGESKIRSATKHYIDDILLDKSVATVKEVIGYLKKFGLIVKFPESLGGT